MLAAVIGADGLGSAYTALLALGAIIGLAGIAGSVYAVGKARLGDQTIKLLSVANEALKNENEQLERKVDRLQRDLEKETALSKKRDEQVRDMRDMVQGVQAIGVLSAKVDERFTKIDDRLEESHSMLMAAVMRGKP